MNLYPSLMCVPIEDLRAEVAALEQAGADGFHLDVMDGSFVPNFALGRSDIEAVRRLTQKPLDIHLMVTDGDGQAARFAALGAQSVSVHWESTVHADRVLSDIKKHGAKAGIALNPATPVSLLCDIINAVDFVLVMTVNPGFAGQAYVDYCSGKVAALAEMRRARGLRFSIETDGAMSEARIRELSALGTDSFVLGTAALFGKGESYCRILSRIKRQPE